MTDKALLTTTEAAALLGVSKQRVKQLIYSGRLPAARFGAAGTGGRWIVARADVIAFAAIVRKTGRPKKSGAG